MAHRLCRNPGFESQLPSNLSGVRLRILLTINETARKGIPVAACSLGNFMDS